MTYSIGGTYTSTMVFSGLAAGTYTVTAQSSGGCISAGTTAVINAQPATPAAPTVTLTQPTCAIATGTITITAPTGIGMTYSIGGTYTTTTVFSGLAAGTYTVTAQSSGGCISAGTTAVINAQPATPAAPTVTLTQPTCTVATGTITITAPTGIGMTYSIGGTYTATTVFSGLAAGTYTVTAKSAAGCVSAATMATINTQPPTPVAPTISVVNNCNNSVLTASGYTGTLLWSTGASTASITVTTSGNYSVTQTVGLCTSASATVSVTINTCGTIAGYVTYDNAYATGLNNVNVRLKNLATGITITAITTPDGLGAPGYYLFTGIAPGSYRLVADFPTGIWGGNNATDALIVDLNVIQSWPLYWLRDTVADVDASHTITGFDALLIKERVVGAIISYPAGDWKFTDTTFTQVSTSNVNLKALCVGDVNGSYANPFKDVSFLTAIEDEVMTVPVNQSFTYNIKSNAIAELGAMTLFMNYDQNRFTIDKVNSSLDGMCYKIENDRIAIAWSNSKPLSLNINDPVISLKITAKESMPEPVEIFTINPGSEFADPLANRIDNFDLKMPKVITSSTSLNFSMVNYPNPFTNWTEIVYTIPEAGKVKLVMTNMFGQRIRTLVDEQQVAGMYKVKVDPADGNLQPGLYLYSIEVDGVTTTYIMTNKMVFTR
jgi:hypothetical protein